MFLFFCIFYALEVEIKPYGIFSFEAHIKEPRLFKLEYYETTNEKIKLKIMNQAGQTIEWHLGNYYSMYTKIQKPQTLFFKFYNQSSKVITLNYRVPDVNKELLGSLGHIEDIDIAREFEETLKKSITNQNNHLHTQDMHLRKAVSNSRTIKFISVIEILFCVGVIYYMHDDILKLFDRRTKA